MYNLELYFTQIGKLKEENSFLIDRVFVLLFLSLVIGQLNTFNRTIIFPILSCPNKINLVYSSKIKILRFKLCFICY